MKIISCENLCIGYSNKVVVKDISLDINKGDYVCIFGENGSGKSTLIKAILGLVNFSGNIYYSGIKQSEIGYLPQQTLVQRDFPASVLEVVLSGCINKKKLFPFYSNIEKKKARDNIRLFNIENLEKKSYRELSGGQQQRVLLARAFCCASKLLILDEPITGLDPIATNEFYSIIRNLNEELGITIIMISHDIKEALRYSNKILYIDNTVKYYGNTKDYIKTYMYSGMVGGGLNA